MGSHRIGKVGPLFFISIVCLFGCNAFATPFGLGEIEVNGTILFDVSELGYVRKGSVEYEVYKQGTYNGTRSNAGSYLNTANNYVYAYRINNTGTGTDLSINAFVVSLLPNGGMAYDPSYELGGTGINPSTIDPSSGSAFKGTIEYEFEGLQILIGGSSEILLFSSPNGPTPGHSVIEGWAFNNVVEGIMVPVPEPVSFFLFGGGLFMLRSKRRSLRRS